MQSNLELCGKASFNSLCISLPSVEFHAIRSAQPVPDSQRWSVCRTVKTHLKSATSGLWAQQTKRDTGTFCCGNFVKDIEVHVLSFLFSSPSMRGIPLRWGSHLCGLVRTPSRGVKPKQTHLSLFFWLFAAPIPVSTALWKRRNNSLARWNVRKWKVDPSFQRDPAEAWKWRLRRLWRTR